MFSQKVLVEEIIRDGGGVRVEAMRAERHLRAGLEGDVVLERIGGVPAPGERAVMGDDQGFPRAFDVLPELRRRAGDMPLIVSVPFGDFVQALKERRLPGGVLYRAVGAPDKDAANRTMDEVRRYRV